MAVTKTGDEIARAILEDGLQKVVLDVLEELKGRPTFGLKARMRHIAKLLAPAHG